MQFETTREDYRIAWLTALAIAIHVAEAALPSPFPGVKPGLANVVTVVVLMQYGWQAAAWVAGLRVLVGSLILGTFLSPAFVLSLTGAVAATAMLFAAHRLPVRFSALGYSVLAALTHMAAQFLCAYYLFIGHAALFGILPVLMTAALGFGLVSGAIANRVLKRVAVS